MFLIYILYYVDKIYDFEIRASPMNWNKVVAVVFFRIVNELGQ
jgi:hypothetical protein